MKASEAMRRELIAAWEDSETVEEAALNIQNVIDRFAPAGLPIEERTWGGWDLNPYSNPEKCGLSLLATAEEDEAYQFDIIALWKDIPTGRLFMAHDAGCSCPSPFENVTGVSDLTEVSTFPEALSFIGAQAYSNPTDASLSSLVTAARQAFRGR